MNINETISALIKLGCQNVTFMASPKGACVVQAEQVVMTGKEGNFVRVVHQQESGNFVDSLNQVHQHVGHIAEVGSMKAMPTGIVVPLKRN